MLPQSSPTPHEDFLIKVQHLLAGCQNEEYLLLKTAIITDHLLNDYGQLGIPSSSGLDVPAMSMADKWYVLKQHKNVPAHTVLCMDILVEQQKIITATLNYSRSKLGVLLSTLSAKYPAIADYSQQSPLLETKYALTLFCCELFACTRE